MFILKIKSIESLNYRAFQKESSLNSANREFRGDTGKFPRPFYLLALTREFVGAQELIS